MSAVFRIKKFYDEKGIEDDQLNTKALQLHSSAFLIYMISLIGVAFGWNYMILNKRSPKALTIYYSTVLFWAITSFVS